MSKKVVKQAVMQMDQDNNMITVFESRTFASNTTGIDMSSIRQACKGKRNHAGGFRWKNVSSMGNVVKNIAKKNKKAIVQKTKYGSVVGIYDNIDTAKTVTNIKSGNIRYVLDGIRKSAGGYIWEEAKIS